MKQQLTKVINHPLFSGSVLMLIGTNFNNVLQYLYHPIMGRLLGVTLYGEMVAAFSLVVLISIIPSTFSMVIIKFVSAAPTSHQISNFFTWIYKLSIKTGLFAFLLFFLLSPVIASFLKISPLTVILAGSTILCIMPVTVMRSVLQGKTEFGRFVISIIVEGLAKLALGSILVILGFSITGALLGIVSATFLGWIISWIFTKNQLLTSKPQTPQLKPIFLYTLPIVVSSLASTSLFSTDVLLVKHYLSPSQAGIYGSLSALGKIIIYAASPIAGVMFPTISSRNAKQTHYYSIFLLGLLLTGFAGCLILAVYKIFPTIAVGSLFGARFSPAIPYLFLFGINVTLFSLSSYLVNFLFSVNCLRAWIYPAIAAIAQIGGIAYAHSSLTAIIQVSFWVSLFLLSTLVIESTIHFQKNYLWKK